MQKGIRPAIAALLVGFVAVAAACSAQTDTATDVAGTRVTTASGVQTSSGPASTWLGDQPGVQHLDFKYGPLHLQPGQNSINTDLGAEVPKPAIDGFIVGITPNLIRTDGSIPGVDVIHLHHGVWTNLSGRGNTFGELFFATGEEKTSFKLPNGFGYEYKASDRWVLNYMLHNLYEKPDDLFITYRLDFIPKDSPLAKDIKPAHPIWMDVESGKIYPVFDALKGAGKDGLFTYPDDKADAYSDRPPPSQRRSRRSSDAAPATSQPPRPVTKPNEHYVDRDMVLLGTGGHLHPGGLHTDLYVRREGASAAPGSEAATQVTGDKARLFRSDAIYYEPAGAVSWDVSMTVTPADWRVRLRKGDVLSTTATYDTERASWYEAMGIMLTWVAYGEDVDASVGNDPFVTKVAVKGETTHGHLPENDNHGGGSPELANMLTVPDGSTPDEVKIADFVYAPGDMELGQSVPVIRKGQSLKFTNYDDKRTPEGLWHTITACQAPCNKSTGIAYPLADAEHQFDSGQLGTENDPIAGGAPVTGKLEWSTPADLPAGTYTYFCRIHPFMRGAFKVTDGPTG